MKIYTYIGFNVDKKKASKKDDKELSWDKGSRRVLTDAAIGIGVGGAVGGIATAIRFRKLVKQLMASNPNLTKAQAEDIVRKKCSIGEGIASGMSSGSIIGGSAGYLRNEIEASKYYKNHKRGK